MTNPVYNIVIELPQTKAEKVDGNRMRKKWKRAVIRKRVNQKKPVGESSVWRKRRAEYCWRRIRSLGFSLTACSLATDEAAPTVARFYMSPPAGPGRTDYSARNQKTGPDSSLSVAPGWYSCH